MTDQTDQTTASAFADALQGYESTGDGDALFSLFSDDPVLLRPEVDKEGSSSKDVTTFWKAYRAQFDDLSTEFTHVVESEGLASLEWTSKGTLSTGRAIEYQGVSLLGLDDQGKVSRFATYYDTAAFLEPLAG